MTGFWKSPHLIHRLITTVLVLVILVAGLRGMHCLLTGYFAARGSQPAFPEIRLQQGISKTEVVERLGVPDAELRRAGLGPSGCVEDTLQYVRGESQLELVFADGRLVSWAETQPIDLAKLKYARTAAPKCCEPTDDRASEQSKGATPGLE